jgi:hypothetical protein
LKWRNRNQAKGYLITTIALGFRLDDSRRIAERHAHLAKYKITSRRHPTTPRITKDQTSATGDQQKTNPADRAITQKIRKAVHDYMSLSIYAHHIKIITQDGKVKLGEPVQSEKGKTNLRAKAVPVARAENLTNQLEVAPPKKRLKWNLMRIQKRTSGKTIGVFGIYSTRIAVENAIDSLMRAGFPASDISVLLPESFGGLKDTGTEKATKAPEGAAVGVPSGGEIGGTLGLLARVGLLAIPDLSPFIAAGPIMAGLAALALKERWTGLLAP